MFRDRVAFLVCSNFILESVSALFAQFYMDEKVYEFLPYLPNERVNGLS